MKLPIFRFALSLLMVSVVIPVATAKAQFARSSATRETVAKKTSSQSSNVDVVLDSQGTFSGYVLDGQGRPMPNELVSIRQGPRRIAETRTDATGKFRVGGMRGGVYQVATQKSISMFRVWTPDAAPKNARHLALVVREPQVVRGQGVVPSAFAADFGTLASTGIAAGGATVGMMASDEAKKSEKMNQQLQAQLTALEAQVNSMN